MYFTPSKIFELNETLRCCMCLSSGATPNLSNKETLWTFEVGAKIPTQNVPRYSLKDSCKISQNRRQLHENCRVFDIKFPFCNIFNSTCGIYVHLHRFNHNTQVPVSVPDLCAKTLQVQYHSSI